MEKEQRCTIAPGESSGFNKFIKLEQVGQFVT